MSKLVFFLMLGIAFSQQYITDIVFSIDCSGSMGGEIVGIRNGFSAFVNGLDTNNVDARFAVVVFGGPTTLVSNFADAATTATALGTLSANCGGTEAGLENMRMILGTAPQSLGLVFRQDARINIIFATDEDSDAATIIANRISPTDPDEIAQTATDFLNADAFLNMLISTSGNSERHYGDYRKDVSDADLSNWDREATRQALAADALTQNSLQARILNGGGLARSFNVQGANDPNFVDNFFAAKVQEIINDPRRTTSADQTMDPGMEGTE